MSHRPKFLTIRQILLVGKRTLYGWKTCQFLSLELAAVHPVIEAVVEDDRMLDAIET